MFKITLKRSIWFIIITNIVLWSIVIIHNSSIAKQNYVKFRATEKYTPLENEAKSFNDSTIIEPSKQTESQESWFAKNWPIITSVLTTIPTIVIKWKEMFEKIRRKKNRKKI